MAVVEHSFFLWSNPKHTKKNTPSEVNKKAIESETEQRHDMEEFKTRFSWHRESGEFFFEFIKSVDENNSQKVFFFALLWVLRELGHIELNR